MMRQLHWTRPFERLEPRVFLSVVDHFSDATPAHLAEGHHGAVVVIGDVDGDGAADVLLGNRATLDNGALLITPVQGASVVSGRTGETIFTYSDGVLGLDDPLDSTGSLFGHALTGLGDVNGDGVPDFGVGAPGSTPSPGSEGRVSLFSGADGSTLRVLETDAPGIAFGHALANLGDVNDDGVPDLAIAQRVSFVDGAYDRRIHVVSGASGATLYTVEIGSTEFNLDQSLVNVGDVDGDGAADWISGFGHVHSGRDGVSIVDLAIDVQVHDTGLRFAPLADVDADGVIDVAVSSRVSQRIDLFSGADGAFMRTLVESPDLAFSAEMVAVGDVDSDGVADLAIGAPALELPVKIDFPGVPTQDRSIGAVLVYSGADGALLTTLTDRDVTAGRAEIYGDHSIGAAVAFGDVTGDGLGDMLAVARQSGEHLAAPGPGTLLRFRGIDASAAIDRPAGFDGAADRYARFVISRLETGELIAHERTDAGWVESMVRNTFGEPLRASSADVETLVHDSRRYIAFIDAGTLRVYQREQGAWRFLSIGGVSQISGDLIGARMPDGEPAFAGIDANGDVVLVRRHAGGAWTGTSISAQARTAGFDAPIIAGDLTFLDSSWGAVHLIGSTSAGEIASIWSSPRSGGWRASIISTPETPQLDSLAAVSTPWGALHIFGTQANGAVGSLWWRPSFVSEWRYNDLSAAPERVEPFAPDTLDAFITAWGTLSVVGVTTGAELGGYYWSPGKTWRFDSISTGAADPAQPFGAMVDTAVTGDRLHVFAGADDASLYHFTWEPGQERAWLFERVG